MVDKQARMLFHANFKVLGFDKKSKLSTINPIFLDYNGDMDKFYRHHLRIHYAVPDKDCMEMGIVNEWSIHAPSKEIVEVYNKIETETKMGFVEKVLNSCGKEEKKEEKNEGRARFDQVVELYKKYDGNLMEIFREMPQINPHTLRLWANIIKKGNNCSIPSAQ